MRVLWLTGVPSRYSSRGSAYNGCGWVSSLESEMASRVELGLAFVLNGEQGKTVRNGVTYYPVNNPFNAGRAGRLFKLIAGHSLERALLLSAYGRIIDDFKPDVIQVFGTEHVYGLTVRETDVPSVIHIQGVLNAYLEHFLPDDMILQDYFMSGKTAAGIFGKIYSYIDVKRRARVEAKIMASARNFIGRTDWDRAQAARYNRNAAYYHVDEVLREPFYKASGTWKRPDSDVLVTTISEAPYKGMDVVLRTAAILKNRYGRNFRWLVFGNVNVPFFEEFTGITCESCGVEPAGVADAAKIASVLASASVYVHPSYNENSPNSLCEAQIVGTPVVASDIGGIPSLVEDSVTGMLAKAGDPVDFAAKIQSVLTSVKFAESLSVQEVRTALSRHDKASIVNDLLNVYRSISGKY